MCDCIHKVDDMLKAHNTRLTQALTFTSTGQGSSLLLRTEQIETGRGKKKAKAMFPTFCPFCGEKYAKEDSEKAAA